eukprot:5902432-Ditylum_brightwellii.AAC.1
MAGSMETCLCCKGMPLLVYLITVAMDIVNAARASWHGVYSPSPWRDSGSLDRSSDQAIRPGDSVAVRRTEFVTQSIVVARGDDQVKVLNAKSGVALAMTSVIRQNGVCWSM